MTAVAQAPRQLAGWWERGEQHLADAVGRVDDDGLAAPTLLAGWNRARLLAHLAGNADALVNLLTWARTGVETPMYASPQAREAAIAAGAALPPARLRAEVTAAAGRLAAAVHPLPAQAWSVPVRTAQGRTVPAAEVLWMRSREVWVHGVDLDTGLTFGDIPDDVLATLADDVTAAWARRDLALAVTVRAAGRQWGAGAQAVRGALPAVTAWLTGRSDGTDLYSDGPLPDLPVWL